MNTTEKSPKGHATVAAPKQHADDINRSIITSLYLVFEELIVMATILEEPKMAAELEAYRQPLLERLTKVEQEAA